MHYSKWNQFLSIYQSNLMLHPISFIRLITILYLILYNLDHCWLHNDPASVR